MADRTEGRQFSVSNLIYVNKMYKDTMNNFYNFDRGDATSRKKVTNCYQRW